MKHIWKRGLGKITNNPKTIKSFDLFLPSTFERYALESFETAPISSKSSLGTTVLALDKEVRSIPCRGGSCHYQNGTSLEIWLNSVTFPSLLNARFCISIQVWDLCPICSYYVVRAERAFQLAGAIERRNYRAPVSWCCICKPFLLTNPSACFF